MWGKVKSKILFFYSGDYEIRTPLKSCKDFVLPLHYSPLNLNIFGGSSLTVNLLCRVITLLTKNIYGLLTNCKCIYYIKYFSCISHLNYFC